MNVLVVGSGAVGSFYGALLAKAGAHITLHARSDFDCLARSGLEICSETALGKWHFTPATVIRDARELISKPDYILLCIKLVEGASRVELIRDAVGPDTAIVLLSNGVEIEDDIVKAFPNNEVISGLAFVCVTRTAPGRIWHQAYGRLAFGNYPTGLSNKVMALCETFRRTGIDCDASAQITTARWQKCIWNAAFNPLSVLSGGLGTQDILSTHEPLVRHIMEDVLKIANALGHSLPANIIDQQISSTHTMPPYKTSMLLDFEAGRPMETEAILGNALRAGQRVGLSLPYLETLYALMKLRESSVNQKTVAADEVSVN